MKEDVLKQLGFIYVERLHQELDILQRDTVHFGAYKDEVSLQAFDMKKAVTELESHAPSLFETLDRLMEDRHYPQHHSQAALHLLCFRSVIVASICCYSRGWIALNYIQNIIGLYLEGSGIKRCVISTLHGCGLSVSHPTILKATAKLNEAGKERITCLTFTTEPAANKPEGKTT